MPKSLKSGIIIVFIANIINLLLSIIRNFILPKYLPITTYADIKTYQLCISYSGLFALGYIDGMHLKYGGKDINELDKQQLSINLSTFRIFQFFILIIFVIFGINFNNLIVITSVFSMIFLNITGYFRSFAQATGEFGFYSKIMNFTSLAQFIINIILIFIFRAKNSISFLPIYTVLYIVIWLILEICFAVKNRKIFQFYVFSLKEFKDTIFDGFLLMCGLFVSNFMTGMDRWFIKLLMPTIAFAQYSFAASIEGFLNYAISPISITLYNHFCRNIEKDEIIKIRRLVSVFSVFIISGAFPVKMLLEYYLTKYLDSYRILFILFASQIYYLIIKCIYINLYKANKKQNIYFYKILLTIFIGFLLNGCMYIIFRNKESVAYATLISCIIWLILCQLDFKDLRYEMCEIIYLVLSTIAFLLLGILTPSYIGFITYIIFEILLSITIMKTYFFALISESINIFRNICTNHKLDTKYRCK